VERRHSVAGVRATICSAVWNAGTQWQVSEPPYALLSGTQVLSGWCQSHHMLCCVERRHSVAGVRATVCSAVWNAGTRIPAVPTFHICLEEARQREAENF